MGMEVCTTLGMLSPEQARRLKEAGLTAYNHNLDTSREFYPSVSDNRPIRRNLLDGSFTRLLPRVRTTTGSRR